MKVKCDTEGLTDLTLGKEYDVLVDNAGDYYVLDDTNQDNYLLGLGSRARNVTINCNNNEIVNELNNILSSVSNLIKKVENL